MVTDAVLAPGYGQMSAATMSAMTLAVRLEALILDPVYTGKSMAGMVALARDGVFHPGARVLFVHTGGLPAEFGYGVNGDRSIYAHLRTAGQDCPSHTSHGMK